MKRAYNIEKKDVKFIVNDFKNRLFVFKVGEHKVTINKDKMTCSCEDMKFRGSENPKENHICKHQLKIIYIFYEQIIKE